MVSQGKRSAENVTIDRVAGAGRELQGDKSAPGISLPDLPITPRLGRVIARCRARRGCLTCDFVFSWASETKKQAGHLGSKRHSGQQLWSCLAKMRDVEDVRLVLIIGHTGSGEQRTNAQHESKL